MDFITIWEIVAIAASLLAILIMQIDSRRRGFKSFLHVIFGGIKMSLFKELNKTKYIENMEIMSKTNLSLLNTLNELQDEYEKLVQENNNLKLEVARFSNNKR